MSKTSNIKKKNYKNSAEGILRICNDFGNRSVAKIFGQGQGISHNLQFSITNCDLYFINMEISKLFIIFSIFIKKNKIFIVIVRHY